MFSQIYLYLIEFMLELNESQKKKFLQFVTGTTRLPMGGDFFF